MAERKIDPKFNIYETYTTMNILNPYRFGGGVVVATIDQPNLLSFPNEYENSYWTKAGATINSTTQPSPDGNNQARTVSLNANSSGLYTFINTSFDAGQILRVSVWVKADVATDIIIGFNGNAQAGNNKGIVKTVGTSWSKLVFEHTAVLNDSGAYITIASTSWASKNPTETITSGARTISLWGASFNII
jgi:hypothetical protein